MPADLRIVPYTDRHAAAFRDLNLAWIEEHLEVEELDRKVLFAPRESILAPGGAILVAERGGVAVGCCALVLESRAYARGNIALELVLE